MAIARFSTGEVYAGYSEINDLVKPVQVGRFDLPDVVLQKINQLSMPISWEGAEYIFKHFDLDAEGVMKNAGFDFACRMLGVYLPPRSVGGHSSFSRVAEETREVATEEADDLQAYLTPHNIHVNDWHFVFSGTIVKGMQLQGDRQAVVYVTPGEWIRLAPSVLNWPIFSFGEPVIGLSYYDREPAAEGWFPMDLHPDHTINEVTGF